MLTYSFSNIGSESLYEHLYECMKNDILSGRLRPGFRLPSKRSFAKNLGISVITVENAYSLLISEGYAYSIPKKGYFVSDINTAMPPEPKEDEPERTYNTDFVLNETLHTLFPFSVWARLMRSVLSEKQPELMKRSPAGGVGELRSAIAEHLYQFRGMRVSPLQIVIGSGTEYLYGLIIQLLGHDKIFALEDPGYGKIAKIYAANGVEYRYVPLDESGVEPAALKSSGADILHISPSHHFPTGIVTPVSRRYELLGWAAESGTRYIIEDDYDSEFRLGGRPVPPLRSMDVSDRVIYMNTFTKSLASTIRISYMVLPVTLADRFYKKLGFYSCTVSSFEQYTLAEFIKGGYFGSHINRMRRRYMEVRDELVSLLDGCGDISGENSGLHFLLRVTSSLTDEELVSAARRAGINVSCLSEYYRNSAAAPQHTLVINYSAAERDSLAQAVSALKTVIDKKHGAKQ